MWRSSSVNHTPYHKPRLPSQPHVIIQPLGGLSRPDLEPPGGLGPKRNRKLGEAPVGKRAGCSDCTRPARQGLVLHAALVGPHAPFGRAGGRGNEVHVRSGASQRRVGPKQPAARHGADPPPVPGPDPGPTNTSPSAPTPVPRAHTALISSTDHSAGVVWRPSTMTKSLPDPVIL